MLIFLLAYLVIGVLYSVIGNLFVHDGGFFGIGETWQWLIIIALIWPVSIVLWIKNS